MCWISAENFLHIPLYKIMFDACSIDWLLRFDVSSKMKITPLQLNTALGIKGFARVTLRRTFVIFNLIDFKITLNHVLFIFLGRTILTFAISIFGHANFSPFSITMYMFNLMCSNRAIETKEEEKKRKIINEFTN